MFNKTLRHCRDVLLRELPHDPDDGCVTLREYMYFALNRYLGKNHDEQEIYKETLLDIMDHIEIGMSFNTKIGRHRQIGPNLFESKKRDDMPEAKMYRKRIMREFELMGEITPKWFGRVKFRDPAFIKLLSENIQKLDAMVDAHYKGMSAFLEFEDDPDQSVAILYECNHQNRTVSRTQIKKFYRNSKPYLLLKFLFINEGHNRKSEFLVSEIFTALKVHKSQRKLADWISETKIDADHRKGRYITQNDEKITFRSHKIDGLMLKKMLF